MRLAIIGYGKMGKEIEAVALERHHSIIARIDNEDDWKANQEILATCDAATEFTTPYVVKSNLYKCFEAGLPVVTGSTGWHKDLEEVTKKCLSHNAALFYASNFSIGVNIFFEINRLLSSLMKNHPDYSARITEIHHLQKLDTPSGTAISLANDLIAENPKYSDWKLGDAVTDSDLIITSKREGSVPGTHIIQWNSGIDSISISHEARSRRGFALGAVLAAEFLQGKTGIYGMADMLKLQTNR